MFHINFLGLLVYFNYVISKFFNLNFLKYIKNRTKFSCKINCSLRNILLKVNFDKTTIGLYLLIIHFMLAKFLKN